MPEDAGGVKQDLEDKGPETNGSSSRCCLGGKILLMGLVMGGNPRDAINKDAHVAGPLHLHRNIISRTSSC